MGKFFKVLLRVIIVIVVIMALLVAAGFGGYAYNKWLKEQDEIITYSGD